MSKEALDDNFAKIDALVAEFNARVPLSDAYEVIQFRADLAGLLVVAMAATYETCVKDTMCSHASSYHAAFGDYATRNYNKISSKIQINDLNKYCMIFAPRIKTRFKEKLLSRKTAISAATGKNIETAFARLLDWRHDFAHSWNRTTTIEEAYLTHRLAKHVIYAFDEAFETVQE